MMTPKEFYQSLSDELKEQLRSCKSLEEAKHLLEEAKVELDPGLLKAVSGGCHPGEGNGEGNDEEDEEDGLTYWIIDGGSNQKGKGGGC